MTTNISILIQKWKRCKQTNHKDKLKKVSLNARGRRPNKERKTK